MAIDVLNKGDIVLLIDANGYYTFGKVGDSSFVDPATDEFLGDVLSRVGGMAHFDGTAYMQYEYPDMLPHEEGSILDPEQYGGIFTNDCVIGGRFRHTTTSGEKMIFGKWDTVEQVGWKVSVENQLLRFQARGSFKPSPVDPLDIGTMVTVETLEEVRSLWTIP